MTDYTVFTVVIEGITTHDFDSLEPAIRAWNRVKFNTPSVTGGITVKTWRAGLMVRDGWILHVTRDKTYLNPNLALA